MEVIDILIAKTKEGKYFALVEKMERQDLREIRKNVQFYCPQCEEKVLLKVGEVNIPHFSHQQETSCLSLFAEGESALHLAGKQQLYTFFTETQELSVQLEPYLPNLNQRPDLLISKKHEKIPIEFQCSRIATAEMTRRTEGYYSAHMKPIWILQTPKKLKQLPQGVTMYSLSRFEEHFLRLAHPKRNFILTYDAYSRKFHYLSALLHISGRKFIVNHRTLSIAKQCFPFAKPNFLTIKELENYYSLYRAERLTFLRQRIFLNKKGIKDPFLRGCYELRLIPSELPEWIGIPIPVNSLSSEHACEWQLALLHFITRKNMKFHEVTVQDLHEFAYLSNHMEKNTISNYEKYLAFLLEIGITSIHTQLSLAESNEMKKRLLQYLQSEMKIEKI